MAIDVFQTVDIIELMENFLEKIRPNKEVRSKLDIGYKIENQSIILFEIRPQWDKPEIIHEYPFAKTTFVKKNNHWRVFWMRSDLKWYSYSIQPTVKSLRAFTELVAKDENHCFFG
jgi:hypothetical protein